MVWVTVWVPPVWIPPVWVHSVWVLTPGLGTSQLVTPVWNLDILTNALPLLTLRLANAHPFDHPVNYSLLGARLSRLSSRSKNRLENQVFTK